MNTFWSDLGVVSGNTSATNQYDLFNGLTFNDNRNLEITNLTEGRKVVTYVNNTGGTPYTISFLAGTGGVATSRLLTKGDGTTTNALLLNKDQAVTITFQNIGNTIVGSIT